MKKGVLKKFPKFHRKAPVSESHFLKKETPTQVFSCEICEIFKNAYFEEHLRTTVFTLSLNP